MTPVASVVIPVRNEECDIEGCLRAVAAQDIGVACLEVVVADGRSTDRTRAVVDQVGPTLGFARFTCIDNPGGGIGSGLNAAVQVATAPVVVRVDARSRIESHYVRTVCAVLDRRPEVGICGGAQVPVDRGSGLISAGIARALGNRLTTGFSRYRRASASGPADTVWMGAFRALELQDVGGWNEELTVNEDYELCERYRGRGLVVWFDAALRSAYLPRSDFPSLARQYYRFGRGKGGRWAEGAGIPARHVVLVTIPPLALVGAAIAARRKGMPTVVGASAVVLFATDHLGSPQPASVATRSAAVAATLISNSSWWTGVVTGFASGRRRRPSAHTGGAGVRRRAWRSENHSACR